MSKTSKFLLPILVLLSGCFWGDEYETKQLIGPYYLCEVQPNSGTWYLHFDDDEFGLADALFNCPIVEAGFNAWCIIMRAVCANPQFFIALVKVTKERAVAWYNIRGPFTKQKFETALKKICGDDLPQFDSDLTKPSQW